MRYPAVQVLTVVESCLEVQVILGQHLLEALELLCRHRFARLAIQAGNPSLTPDHQLEAYLWRPVLQSDAKTQPAFRLIRNYHTRPDYLEPRFIVNSSRKLGCFTLRVR